MATSRSNKGKGGGGSTKGKPKSMMSPKTRAFFALNDLLTLHKDDEEPSPEVIAARAVLKDNGFDERPSRAQEVKQIEEEIRSIDATQPGAATRVAELAKRLSAASRGKVIATASKSATS